MKLNLFIKHILANIYCVNHYYKHRVYSGLRNNIAILKLQTKPLPSAITLHCVGGGAMVMKQFDR